MSDQILYYYYISNKLTNSGLTSIANSSAHCPCYVQGVIKQLKAIKKSSIAL